jgi:hypothetical protein
MARLLIGSSNVYKFYKPNIFKQYKDYSVVKCCNIETFDTHLDDLSEAYKKAGTAFRGQIEQHFVVLNEGQSYQQQPRPQPTVGRGGNGKRRRDDEEAGTSSGKGAKTRKT